MDKKRFLWIPSLPLLLLGGCDRDGIADDIPEVTGGKSGDIVFEIGFAPQGGNQNTDKPQTRVATAADFNSTWENSDEIGIFAVAHGEPLAPSDNPVHNVKLTCTDGTWSAEVCWPYNAEKMDFYAYYPYDDNGGTPETLDPTAIAFNVLTDQNGATAGKNNYNLSDLLTAKSDNEGEGYAREETVSLQFTHALAMVQVSIPSEGKGYGPTDNLTVTLRNVKPKSTVNLNGISETPGSEITLSDTGNDPADIIMHRVEQPGDANYQTSYTYRALVPAQNITQDDPLFSFGNEVQQLTANNTSGAPLTLAGGKAQKLTCSLPQLVHTVPVSKGTFRMGSPDSDTQARANEKPQHWVRLTQDFHMGKYPVTNAQYAAFLNANKIDGTNGTGQGSVTYDEDGTSTTETQPFVSDCTDPDYPWGVKWSTDKWEPVSGYEDYPAIYVTWYGAKAFADWVGGFLPTEAQWEYACRAGTTTIYSYGDTADGNYMWYDFNSGETTHEVGTKKANPWGLFDMHGNVYEWCLDQWDGSNNYQPADSEDAAITDPLVQTGNYRVFRGGGWINDAKFCRSALRVDVSSELAINYVGFRVVFIP